jgi:hypothetical protein
MRYIFLFLLFSTLNACTTHSDKASLVYHQKSNFSIVISANADSLTGFAASEVQKYIYEVSGVKLSIENKYRKDNYQLIIGKSLINDKSLLAEINSLNEDGFIIKVSTNKIVLAGKEGKANMYAAYTFIEEFLGCQMLSLNEYYIPKSKNIEVAIVNKTYEPAFKLRKYFRGRPCTTAYMNWHKLESLDEWGYFVHTFDDLVPPDKYFQKHPEYFALVGGRRLMDAQLCLSNPDLINTLIENLRNEISKKPDKQYWSVSQNDCYNYCTCDNCKKLYEKYGSVSGAYIQMANQLAEEFPDKTISTLAYQFSRSAPKNIKPLPNVNIMLCSIECNRSMPLAVDKRSISFVKDLNDWSRLTNNIFLWDYVTQFKNYLTPFPNIQVLQPNLQLFKSKNASMAFQQGSGRTWSDLAELKQFLIAKLLWNPDVNVDSLTHYFIDKYYGLAAPFIYSYFKLTHQSLNKHDDEWLNIYGYPMDYTDSYLTADLLKKYREIMDKAEASVQDDSIYLKRVLRARLPVDYAYLDIALNGNFNDITFIDENSNGNKVIRKDMLNYLNRFVEISKLTGATTINERQFKTPDYQKYVLTKLNRMVKKNLAKGKTVKVLTEYSETYPVNGARALTDGLMGDLDFHHNWLGFQGHNMIVNIDLQKPETISSVSMNFLKAVNSWVFLPEEVFIEISNDGKNYKRIATLFGDNSNRNYLVESIPFNLKFKPKKTRYIRVTAISMKQCPEWHRGFGNPSWIFIDELIIE